MAALLLDRRTVIEVVLLKVEEISVEEAAGVVEAAEAALQSRKSARPSEEG